MKKIALVVFLGFGLLRAEVAESAKAESVCENVDIASIYDRHETDFSAIAKFFYDIDSEEEHDKFKKQYLASADKHIKLNRIVLNLLGTKTYHIEIKRSSKESLCAYKLVFDYLNTQVTEQELERFEQFAADNDMYDWYNDDDDTFWNVTNKDIILYALKFLKFHNKIDELVYNKKDFEGLSELGRELFLISKWDMSLIKMIYGKVQTGNVYHSLGGVYGYLDAKFLEQEIYYLDETGKKEAESIVKWAKTIK